MTIQSPNNPSSGFLLHHDDEGFLDALQLLIDSEKAKSAEDLVRYADRAGEPNAAEFLRALAAENLPVDLVYDALSVHIRIVAFKRSNRILQECRQKQVGMVMPLPPHVLDSFIGLPRVSVMIPDGHHRPVALRGREIDERKGSRTGRNVAPQMQVLVFEAYREDDDYFIDPAVADVVDLRIIPTTTQLLMHLRPHRHPDDIPLVLHGHTLHLL